MANTLSGNVWYVDTQHSAASDDLTDNSAAAGVVLTATAADGRIVLADASTGQTKLDLRVTTAKQSEHFDFTFSPIGFPNGIKVATLANAVASVILARPGSKK